MNPGQTLKEKRTQMGLSVNDVAVATKINPRILKALEDGQKENLPPRSFVRGFIRSYANYLKLNANEILQAFEAEDGIVATPTEAPLENKDVPNKSSRDDISRMDKSSRLGTIMVTVGIVVLIVLIFGIKKIMDRYAQERVVEPAQIELETAPTEDGSAPEKIDTAGETKPADDSASPTTATATTTEPPAPTPAAATATAETAPTPKEEKTAPVATPATAAAPVPAPTPVAAAAPAPAPAPKVEATPTPAPVAKPAAAKESPQEIIVEALDQVELTISIDGGSSKKITLKPESIHTIKAQKQIVLDVSDGGLVNIIQNGNDRGNPGQLGKATKLKYP